MNVAEAIIKTVLAHYPAAQAIYLFGSFGTVDERSESDADIALLLSPAEAKKAGSLVTSPLVGGLEALLQRKVDLINLRQVPTVLQKEVVAAERRIHLGDRFAAEEFEMLVLSFYQKLNEERGGIIAAALADRRFHKI